MKKLLILITITFYTFNLAYSQETNVLTYGEKITIHSEILNQDREILVHLPENYNYYVSSYPVLYVMDGEDLFYPVTGLVKMMSLSQAMIPEMIVVGIPNVDRYSDFLPLVDTISGSGGADRFIAFFNKELFPYINKNYRTDSFSILFGHSYLGFFSLYCLKKYPDTFDAYIAGSPSLVSKKWCSGLFTKTYPNEELSQNKFLYYSVGELESEKRVNSTNEFTSYLKSENPKHLIWNNRISEDENHDSNAIRTFMSGMYHIYPDWKDILPIIEQGMPAIENHYAKMSDRYNYKIKVHEFIYQMLGNKYLENGKLDMSIEIFTKYTQAYGSSYAAYNYLGKAYLAKNNKEKAIQNFKKALELKPDFTEAENNLKEIHANENKRKTNKS